MPSYHARQPLALLRDWQMRRRISSVFTSPSFARNRFEIVKRRSPKRPLLVFPQICVKPRK